MQIRELLKPIYPDANDLHISFSRLVLDSRKVQPNDLFIATKGTNQDGCAYIDEAIMKGAVGVLYDAQNENDLIWQKDIPLIPIKHLSQKLASFASHFYDYPAKKMYMIGVTGTNGKTSCTHFLGQFMQRLNYPCGVIGTLGYGFLQALKDTGYTTPDAIALQEILAKLHIEGAKGIAMEVSSHSIDQGRVNDIPFDCSIFTNLSPDHLDYHGDMATYAAVKYRFLEASPQKKLVINAEDLYGSHWLQTLSHQELYAYSTEPVTHLTMPCTYTKTFSVGLNGITAFIVSPWGEGEVTIPLTGRFNLSNVLAAITALCLHGFSFQSIIQQIPSLHPVPGRMQTFGGQGKPVVIVDYSHSPDALLKALQTLREQISGQLICIFGCGGDRDKTKRPLMAQIAESYADQIIITNDNPRTEDPNQIVQDIMAGFGHPERVRIVLDRAKAIAQGIQSASTSDCILVAGKGAEKYQEIGTQKIPFDDAAIVRLCLSQA